MEVDKYHISAVTPTRLGSFARKQEAVCVYTIHGAGK
jgi:hypothetical protein